jgi:hypothetical protein
VKAVAVLLFLCLSAERFETPQSALFPVIAAASRDG